MEQKIHHNMDQSALLSETYMIQHKADRFVLDFKGMNIQHLDPADQIAVVINHKTVMLDPWKMKEFVESAQDNLKKYEEKFGKIKVPEPIEKERKETKKKKKESGKSKDKTAPAVDTIHHKQSYFG